MFDDFYMSREFQTCRGFEIEVIRGEENLDELFGLIAGFDV